MISCIVTVRTEWGNRNIMQIWLEAVARLGSPASTYFWPQICLIDISVFIMMTWHNASRTLSSQTTHNKIIQRLECSGHWRGITLTLFCHHKVRNSRLRLEINKVRTSVITLSNTTQGQLNSPTNPYLRFQNIPTTIKIRILWDRKNRTMFDTPSEGIVKSLLVLFFLAITVLVTLIIKEIRSSITEYNKHCTLNCKIDVVWSEIYFIFREKYSLDSSVIPMVE